LPLHEERADDPLRDLPRFLGPFERLPLQDEVAERLDPDIGRSLLAPPIDDVDVIERVNADDAVLGEPRRPP
jgi:hypothetical protein